MKRVLLRKSFLFLLFVLLVEGPLQLRADEVRSRIEQLKGISSIEALDNSKGFAEKYVVRLRQPLDHQHPEKGAFDQRVIVLHRSTDRPTVIVTEGYSASYALSPRYTEELSEMWNTNIIFVEHRFFDESTPTPCDWQYMTDRQAMADLHQVVTLFKSIYSKKWISTGVSKGGQTCMEFRSFYPEDVDVSVPYVGPLCFGVEDGRHEPFLRRVGTDKERQRIQEFQMEALKRKQKLLPEFEAFCLKNHLRFNIPMRDIYDYCVLEYSFAFWQWGRSETRIPPVTASDADILGELLAVSSPDYFMPAKSFTPFFYQAAYELGYYGYDMKPFKKLMSIKSTRNYLRRVMLPDSLRHVKYHKKLSRSVKRYLTKNDPQMLIVYGEIDPWTAAGVTWLRNKKNMRVFVQPRGSHTARIGNMPDDMRREIVDILTRWLGEAPVK